VGLGCGVFAVLVLSLLKEAVAPEVGVCRHAFYFGAARAAQALRSGGKSVLFYRMGQGGGPKVALTLADMGTPCPRPQTP
jgi:hypothetical protein